MSTLCELRRASLGYDSHVVLSDLDLAVAAGDFIVIGGPNGGGKSTLLKSIARLLPPLRGEVRGHARLGYVPQQAAIEPALPVTALEMVRLGAAAGRAWWRGFWPRDRADSLDCLRACRAEEFARKAFHTLSGGQRQRVLLARALATEPQCLLLDEPTAGVDRETQATLAARLTECVRERGLAVVIITHEAEPFLDAATRFLRVENGHVQTVEGLS